MTQENLEQLILNKGDDDIINTLLYLKETTKDILNLAKELNLTKEQIEKAANKYSVTKFNQRETETNYKELEKFLEEEDIINAMFFLTKLFNNTRSILNEIDGFEMEMIYKSINKEKDNNTPQVKQKEKDQTQKKETPKVVTEKKEKEKDKKLETEMKEIPF